MNLAHQGYFDKPTSDAAPAKKNRFKFNLDFFKSGSSGQFSFLHWGSPPMPIREWWWLGGDQLPPLGSGRWVAYNPSVQTRINQHAHMMIKQRMENMIMDLEPEQYQIWYKKSSRVSNTNFPELLGQEVIAGINKDLWNPKADELPPSELLRNGGRIVPGYFQIHTEDAGRISDYMYCLSTLIRPSPEWKHPSTPRARVVLMVEEAHDATMTRHSNHIASSPEYVVRVTNLAGNQIFGLKQNEARGRTVSDLRQKLEHLVSMPGDKILIALGRELKDMESLPALIARMKPLDVQLVIQDEKTKAQQAFQQNDLGGTWMDLARSGYFDQPEPKPKASCVVS